MLFVVTEVQQSDILGIGAAFPDGSLRSRSRPRFFMECSKEESCVVGLGESDFISRRGEPTPMNKDPSMS